MLRSVLNKWFEDLHDPVTLELFIKRIIYIACFAGLCMIDQVIGSATGSIQYGLKNYTGVIIGIVILTGYKIRDFAKIPYFAWAILFLIARTIILLWAKKNVSNYMEWSTNLWYAGVLGLVIIRMIYRFVINKRRLHVNWKLLGIWLFMMLWMMIFRSDLGWPRAIFVGFLCFYLTDFKKADLNNLYSGMAEGVILGFLIIQTQALLHRPYDTLRYQGMYTNANMNALFYAFSYCAVLCKWYEMKLKKRSVKRRIVPVVLAGLIFGLAFLTGGRAALLTIIAVTVFFLIFQSLSCKTGHFKRFILDGAMLVLAAIICFLPAYGLVRYVPAWVDDPVFFEGDIKDDKVQKGDPIDSEKYIGLGEVLEANFGRFFGSSEEVETQEAHNKWLDILSPVMVAEASEWEEEYWYADEEVYVAPGTDSRHPLLSSKYAEDSIKIRIAIYEYFVKELNIVGHREQPASVWVTPTYCAPHTHNVLLQMAYDFGLPVGILFGVIIVSLYNKVIFDMFEKKQGAKFYRMFVTIGFATVFVLFGLVEINWIFGQLPFTMFFVMQRVLYHKDDTVRG